MKLLAELTQDFDDGIKYLIIETDEKNTGGCYLFFHQSLDEPCEADLWFSDIESAKRQAKFNYEIDFDGWHDF
ncbi:hypothetical protein RZS08_59905, partial [Arthrospira platensis SPKY1]|nr:hypothetical protein [Arthrospira platensis SPKY1]